MSKHRGEAHWEGPLLQGRGRIKLGSSSFQWPLNYDARFNEKPGVSPEELVGAALTGSFSMALARLLERDDHRLKSLDTVVEVHLRQDGEVPRLGCVELTVDARVDDLDRDAIGEVIAQALRECPLASVLQGDRVALEANLRE